MRVDHERKSVDIESRDTDYVLSAYVRLYLFQMRNEDPEVITFPMFSSAPHPYKAGVRIPIEYVPDTSPTAIDIIKDGSNVATTTPEAEAEADKKEDEYKSMKEKIAKLEYELEQVRSAEDTLTREDFDASAPAPISAARAAFVELPLVSEEDSAAAVVVEPAISGISGNQPSPERLAKAKKPDVVLPPGTATDYGGRPDPRDQKRIARDIAPSKDINEDEEREDNELVKRVKGKKEK